MKKYSPEKTLIVLAPAKINLHLQVLGLRSDGFHELAMVMQSIDLKDILTFKYRDDGIINLDIENSNLSNGADNLIVKAAKFLKTSSGRDDLGVNILLKKNIPIGAGLAGGSTDAAATLYGLNILWALGYTSENLEYISSKIGSDIAFCIEGGTQLCFGRGEILEQAELPNPSLGVILLKDPLISVSTPWAYDLNKKHNQSNYLTTEQAYEVQRGHLRSAEWLKKSNANLIPPLNNDLEKVVAPITPSVRKALELLRSIPENLSVAMSGSGPSCFALFKDFNTADKALERNYNLIKSAGFEAWSCSLLPYGVDLQND
tara:strand:+ start:109 stop:1059 length:951 start_codon:yes stop_codon:yes gene_type:complete